MPYDFIYRLLYDFSTYRVYDMLLCRMLAPIVLVAILFVSRIIASSVVKFFAILIALIFYFLPSIVTVFVN